MQVIRLRPISTVLSLLAVAAGSLVLSASASAANQLPNLSSISCPAAGQCMAVGSYSPSANDPQGLILSERDGIWADGLRLVLPANASQVPDVNLSDVACAKAGDCTVVGTYTTKTGLTEGLFDSSWRYWWRPVATPKLPAAADSQLPVDVHAVSCWGAGDCLAVGDFGNKAGVQEAVAWSEQDGAWSRGAALTLPGNASSRHGSSLSAIACPASASCQISGWYLRSGSAGAITGLVAGYANTKLSRGLQVRLPSGAAADPEVDLPAISCAEAGYCTAVGNYTDSNGQRQPLVVRQSAATWSAGTSPPLPVNAAISGQYATLDSVSCSGSDTCAAGGSYFDSLGSFDPLLLNGTSGQLNSATEPLLPATAGPNQNAQIDSVSCDAAQACLAAGYFNGVGRHLTPFAVLQRDNAWGELITPAAPANVAAGSGTSLGPVACTGAGSCALLERYKDTAQDQSIATYAIDPSGDWSLPQQAHTAPLTAADARSSLDSVRVPFPSYDTRKELLADNGAPLVYESQGPAKLDVTWTTVVTKRSGAKRTSSTVTVASFRGGWLGANIHEFLVKLTAEGRELVTARRSIPIKVTLRLDAEGLRPLTETASFIAP